jgi:hypothetical protein
VDLIQRDEVGDLWLIPSALPKTSVGAHEFPAEVFAPVRDLLVRLAVVRHGQSAVISSERTQVISAF